MYFGAKNFNIFNIKICIIQTYVPFLHRQERNGKNLSGLNSARYLGFAPRSNSLVYEPAVLSNSIFSLSGLTSVRKSAKQFYGSA